MSAGIVQSIIRKNNWRWSCIEFGLMTKMHSTGILISYAQVDSSLPRFHTLSLRGHAKSTMATEKDKMVRGELFLAFTPDIIAARARCKYACDRFNAPGEVPRRRLIELWRE